MKSLDLLLYSEWLDGERLMVVSKDDKRTHEDLVNEFLSSR